MKKFVAVFENGAFRPASSEEISLPDGARVRLTVEAIAQGAHEDVLALAANVYAGLSDSEVADIERIAMDRTHFFSR